jgi:hypothetical protein
LWLFGFYSAIGYKNRTHTHTQPFVFYAQLSAD